MPSTSATPTSLNRGEEQAFFLSPMRAAIDKGLRPTNHTDFVVAPLDQMFVLWTAVNRISRAGVVIGPEQRVTPLEALQAITINAARQYSEEDSKGSITVGKLADLVILDRQSVDRGCHGNQGHPGRRDDQRRQVDLSGRSD